MSAAAQRIMKQAKEALGRPALEAIVAAYDKALSDPRTVIPTTLHAAIEAGRKELREPKE